MYESIIPTADTIPVHWLWFEVLLIFTFFIHMILMNFILGGSLLTVWDLLRGKLEKKASGSIPTLIALTVNFGVPPLLFVQVLYGHLFYTSSVMVAVPWILVIPVLILAYYGAYLFVKKGRQCTSLVQGCTCSDLPVPALYRFCVCQQQHPVRSSLAAGGSILRIPVAGT